MAQSRLEEEFIKLWEKLYPKVKLLREKRIINNRRFAFDFIHLPSKVAIEINGGTWGRRRTGHSTGMGIARDYEKNNLAVSQGWAVFWLDAKMIDEENLILIYQAIARRG